MPRPICGPYGHVCTALTLQGVQMRPRFSETDQKISQIEKRFQNTFSDIPFEHYFLLQVLNEYQEVFLSYW